MFRHQFLQVSRATLREDRVEADFFQPVVGVVVDGFFHQLFRDAHDRIAFEEVFAVVEFDFDGVPDHLVGGVVGGYGDVVLFTQGFEDVRKQRQVGVKLVTGDEFDHVPRAGDFVAEDVDVAESEQEVDAFEVDARHGAEQHFVRGASVDVAGELFGDPGVFMVEGFVVFVEVEHFFGVAAGIEQGGVAFGMVDFLHDLKRQYRFDEAVVGQAAEIAEVLFLRGVVETELGEGHFVDGLFVFGKHFEVFLFAAGVDFGRKPGVCVHEVVNVAVPAVFRTVEVDEARRRAAVEFFVEDLFALRIVVVSGIHACPLET